MKEVTVTRDNDELIAHIFIENGSIQAIMENGYKVNVDGKELEKDMKVVSSEEFMLNHSGDNFELTVGGVKIPHIKSYEVLADANHIIQLKLKLSFTDKDVDISVAENGKIKDHFRKKRSDENELLSKALNGDVQAQIEWLLSRHP